MPWPTGQARLVQGRSRRWESDPRLTRFADIMPQHPRSTPTFADWQAAAPSLGLEPKGRELVGPCPSCGGDNRFSVWRRCNPSQDNPEAFLAILKAAGFAGEREPSAKACQHGKPVWQDAGYEDRFLPYQIKHLPNFGDHPIVIVDGETPADAAARVFPGRAEPYLQIIGVTRPTCSMDGIEYKAEHSALSCLYPVLQPCHA